MDIQSSKDREQPNLKRAMQQPDTTYILTFHGLGKPKRNLPSGEDEYWIEVSFFEAILDLIKRRDDVRITFDDSNSSDFHIAYPALTKRNLTATFFLVSRRIDVAGYLAREEIQKLAVGGMTIGSHGTLHRPWATLNAADLDEELRQSKAELEEVISTEIQEAACPLGSYNRSVLNGLRANGYLRVYTSDRGPSKSGQRISPRNTIVRSHNLETVKEILEVRPRGLRAAARALKLCLKRWR
jgi:peptidoglycan/xylan/chitin deacetylase (PgdA/CDA1 family)